LLWETCNLILIINFNIRAKILIRPVLRLNNDVLVDLRLLENITITLTTVNVIDNIRV